MPKLKITSGSNFIKFFKKLGFTQSRQVGSHVVLVKENITIVIPLHKGKDLGRGLISAILKESNIDKNFYQKNI